MRVFGTGDDLRCPICDYAEFDDDDAEGGTFVCSNCGAETSMVTGRLDQPKADDHGNPTA